MDCSSNDMTTEEEDKQNESSLFSSFYKRAKEKTLSTLALVRQDLTEFGEAVRDEGSSLMTMTSNVLRDQAGSLEAAGNMMRSLVDTVSNVLFEDTTKGEEQFEEPIVAEPSEGKFSYETLDLDPTGSSDAFAAWQSTFNLRERESECKRLLHDQPELLDVYHNLVPREIDRLTFWQRYFYRIYQIDKAKKEHAGDATACSSANDQLQTVQNSPALPSKSIENENLNASANDSSLEVSDDDEGAVIVSHRAVVDKFESQ
uniref:BSD domain-containing protein n=1 Tax=Trichuris muris TaxID=70415 RepID=A0A5S6Q975_TRIMR